MLDSISGGQDLFPVRVISSPKKMVHSTLYSNYYGHLGSIIYIQVRKKKVAYPTRKTVDSARVCP